MPSLEHVWFWVTGDVSVQVNSGLAQLLRLLVANYPFVDGNKRTALASAVAFYALNSYALDYDRELKGVPQATRMERTRRRTVYFP